MLGAPGRAFGLAFCAAALLGVGPAWADQRYAEVSPGDGDPTVCAEEDPCSLQNAVEDPSVAEGDEVIVLPGTYDLGTHELIVATRIDLHGAAAGPRPKLTSANTTSTLTVLASDALVRDLEVENTAGGSGHGFIMSSSPAIAEQLVVTGGSNAWTCNVVAGTFRDSSCRNVGTGEALGVNVGGDQNVSLALRNVTAYAPATGPDGVGLDFTFSAGTGSITIDARNVIASGGAFDARANGATATINLTNSNYDSVDPAGTGTVTPPGTGTNQTQPPALADPAAGNFHQLAGSPTIDAGAGDPLLGSADIDGEPRVQGAAPDIGADEFTVDPPPSGDTLPPDTKILKGPKRKTRKRKAKFQFGASEPGATFECQLDGAGFVPCISPHKYRGLSRTAHVFAVRAIDQAGNADSTPADRDWRVRKKKRK